MAQNSGLPEEMKKQILDNCTMSFQKYEKYKDLSVKAETTESAEISKEEIELARQCSKDMLKASCEEIMDMENKIPSCKKLMVNK